MDHYYFKVLSNKVKQKNYFIFCYIYAPNADWKLRLSLVLLKNQISRFITHLHYRIHISADLLSCTYVKKIHSSLLFNCKCSH